MKKYEELNYYETLEIPPGASPFEISQAYKDALSIYSEDSLISYSFFDDDERAVILKKIEEAFLTLIDQRKRAEYDRMLVRSGDADESILNKKERKKPRESRVGLITSPRAPPWPRPPSGTRPCCR